MSATYSTPVSQTSNVYLSGITWGTRWTSGGTSTTIVYAQNPSYLPNAQEVAAYTQVFADISKVCNINFVAGSANTADLLLSSGTFLQMTGVYGALDAGILGIADPPGIYTNPSTNDEQSWVFANRDMYSANALNKGGFDYITWLHEIGHAIGLAHPHDNGGTSTIYPGVTSASSLGTDNLNQGIFTTMTYNDGWNYFAASMPKQFGWQSTPMAFDVAALQNLYGANMTTATGNDYYFLKDTASVGSSYQCIWDAGGTDCIYYGGSYSVYIDLRAATLTSGYGAGGYVSYVTGTPLVYAAFTIANGATIENAVGGSANDTLIGNNSNNMLLAYGGNDTIFGLAGNDYIDAGAGNDSIRAGGGNDNLLGGLGNDYFWGEAGADYFNLGTDAKSGAFDFIYDLEPGTDYILLPRALQVATYFNTYGDSAYCYVALADGTSYSFGGWHLTASQLQAATYLY